MDAEALLQRAAAFARQACGLTPGARVVVGLSAGPDSLTLLDVLHRLGYEVIAAHLHHGLRPEADADARAAASAAAQLGVPLVSAHADVLAAAARRKEPLEAAAREARYRFLFTVAQQRGASAVAVGHTADDQAETVLMHVLRGSGLPGLAGLRPRRQLPRWGGALPLVRPLLFAPRTATVAYALARGLPVRWDASNWQRDVLRNRLRLDILPRLQVENPALPQALARLAAVAAADEDFLTQEAQRRWPEVALAQDAGYVGLRRRAFLAAHLALQRRWLRLAAAALGAQAPSFSQTEAARQQMQQPGGGPRSWFAGLWLWVGQGEAWLFRSAAALPTAAWPQCPTAAEIPLRAGETVRLAGGWRLRLRGPQPLPPDWLQRAAPTTAWLDADAVTMPLTVRPRRPGDVIAPLGLGGRRQKISRLFINAQIPHWLRPRWPLVTSAAGVLWVPLLTLAEGVRVTPATRQAFILQLFKES